MMHKDRKPHKASIYDAFIYWSAMSYPEKVQAKILDQNSFARLYKVDKVTLSRWKQRPEFEKLVDANRNKWAVSKTPDVLHALYKSAVKGNPKSQLLWLQYFKGFSGIKKEGKSKTKTPAPMVFAEKDMRHLISLLPKERQAKYHAIIMDLVREVEITLSGGIPKDPDPSDGPGWDL
jgi:hypothetical protein